MSAVIRAISSFVRRISRGAASRRVPPIDRGTEDAAARRTRERHLTRIRDETLARVMFGQG